MFWHFSIPNWFCDEGFLCLVSFCFGYTYCCRKWGITS